MKKAKLISSLSIVATVGALAPVTITATSCTQAVTLAQSDKDFLNNINTVIESLDFEGVPFKAVHAVKNAGYSLFEHKFSNQAFELVLNMDTKKFAVLFNDIIFNVDSQITNFDKSKVWKFVTEYDSKSEYSQHLNDNFVWDSSKTLEVTGGLDTGTNTNVKKIKYVGTNTQKTCYLRTYTEFLTIEPKVQDTIHHFHYANNVFVKGNGDSRYIEYGKSCYLQVQNTKVSFALTKAKDEPCAVDVFEPVDLNVVIGEQQTGATIYAKAGSVQTSGAELFTTYGALPIVPINTIDDLIAVNEKCVARLNTNIDVSGSATSHWTNKWNVVLDLAGKSIFTPNDSVATTLITVASGTLILMDSGGPGSDATIYGSQAIEVKSTNGATAKFIMNGGKIQFNVNQNEARSAVVVGITETIPSSETHSCEFYMYGGQIAANNIKQSDLSKAYAIKTANKGSYSYFVYGDVYGSDGTIITDTTEGQETYGSAIEVFGGNFSTDSTSICINLTRESKFSAVGGSFTGGTCIASVNSEINLNGGVFNANGTYSSTIFDDGYLTTDGSVIECYWAKDETATQPKVVCNNVQMHSVNGNILHLGSAAGCVTPLHKNWMEFISGCYYFNGTVHTEGCNAGMLYDTTTYAKFEWLQKGLWNNKPVE